MQEIPLRFSLLALPRSICDIFLHSVHLLLSQLLIKMNLMIIKIMTRLGVYRVPFLWPLDFGIGTWIWDLDLGPGFGTWIWDLDLGLGFETGLGLDVLLLDQVLTIDI